MQNKNLSKRYAKALLEICTQRNLDLFFLLKEINFLASLSGFYSKNKFKNTDINNFKSKALTEFISENSIAEDLELKCHRIFNPNAHPSNQEMLKFNQKIVYEKEFVLNEYFSILLNSITPSIDKKKAFNKIIELLKLSNLIKDFMMLLIENNRVILLCDIAKKFYFMILEKFNVVNVDIIVPFDLNSDNKAAISSIIEQKIASSIQLNFKTQSKILGGIIIISNFKMLDMSLETKLKKMKCFLLENHHIT